MINPGRRDGRADRAGQASRAGQADEIDQVRLKGRGKGRVEEDYGQIAQQLNWVGGATSN